VRYKVCATKVRQPAGDHRPWPGRPHAEGSEVPLRQVRQQTDRCLVDAAKANLDVLMRQLFNGFAKALSDAPLTVRVGLCEMPHQGDPCDRQPRRQRECLVVLPIGLPIGDQQGEQRHGKGSTRWPII